MNDTVDRTTRSRMMGQIRGRDTKPERQLRAALHAAGFRFRLHTAHLPGRPDIVLPKFRAVIFVHGCFWHRHPDCRYATSPKSNAGFWAEKFKRNVERDERVERSLLEQDWRVAKVWECAIRESGPNHVAHELGSWLPTKSNWLQVPIHPQSTDSTRRSP